MAFRNRAASPPVAARWSKVSDSGITDSQRLQSTQFLEMVEAFIRDAGITEFELLFIDGVTTSDSIHKTLLLDKVETKEDALIEIYRRLRPGNPATPEVAQDFVDNMFFKSSYYDLSGVGRSRKT